MAFYLKKKTFKRCHYFIVDKTISYSTQIGFQLLSSSNSHGLQGSEDIVKEGAEQMPQLSRWGYRSASPSQIISDF